MDTCKIVIQFNAHKRAVTLPYGSNYETLEGLIHEAYKNTPSYQGKGFVTQYFDDEVDDYLDMDDIEEFFSIGSRKMKIFYPLVCDSAPTSDTVVENSSAPEEAGTSVADLEKAGESDSDHDGASDDQKKDEACSSAVDRYKLFCVIINWLLV